MNGNPVDLRRQREALKQRLAERTAKPAAATACETAEVPTPAPHPMEAPRPDPKLPKAGKAGKSGQPPKPSVTYQCGHQEGLAGLAHRVCRMCANNYRRDANRKKREKQEAARAEVRPPDTSGRLPDGAEMRLRFNRTELMWAGTLTVKIDGQDRVFTAVGSGVEWVQRELGKQCREAVAVAVVVAAQTATQGE